MFSEVKELFQEAKTEEELLDIVHMLCEPHGAVVNADVLWHTRPGQAMCMVEMPDMQSAHTVAGCCGAMTFGDRYVVFNYEASVSFCRSQGYEKGLQTPP